MSMSPFSIKCETHLITLVSHLRQRETRVSNLALVPKIFHTPCSLPTHSSFSKPPSPCPSVAASAPQSPRTPPSPPVVLDSSHGAHHHLDPALKNTTALTPPPEHVIVPDLTSGPLLDLGFLASPTPLPSPTFSR
jgi:hypothetical protein